MKRKSFETMRCPVAQTIERVGDQWTILILRDALNGLTRFDEFEKSLGIAPNMLTRRLAGLVEAGFMERRRYSERPPRDEYLLTERGLDFQSVVLAMLAFGNRQFAGEDKAVTLIDTDTGLEAELIAVDAVSGARIGYPRFRSSADRLFSDAEAGGR